MSDSKLDFSKARPGDVLWSDKYGDVEFLGLAEKQQTYPIRCSSRANIGYWQVDGKLDSRDVLNDLHWSRPVFEEPPPPKRMKKVRIEREAHFVRTVGRDGFTVHLSYTNTNWCPVDCVHHQPVVFDFEVPE